MSDDKKKQGHPAAAIPGEAQLYQLIPKGYSLLVMLAMGIFGTAYGYFQLQQQAKDILFLHGEIEKLESEVALHHRSYRQGLKK